MEAETDKAVARGNRSVRVQLRKDYGYHGHGGSGFMADASKGGFKGAGKAPDGDKFFWATLEPIGPRD